jgi:hypothetical protein
MVVRSTRNAAASSVAEIGPRDRMSGARFSRVIRAGRAIMMVIMHRNCYESSKIKYSNNERFTKLFEFYIKIKRIVRLVAKFGCFERKK